MLVWSMLLLLLGSYVSVIDVVVIVVGVVCQCYWCCCYCCWGRMLVLLMLLLLVGSYVSVIDVVIVVGVVCQCYWCCYCCRGKSSLIWLSIYRNTTIQVAIEMPFDIRSIECPSHAIRIKVMMPLMLNAQIIALVSCTRSNYFVW